MFFFSMLKPLGDRVFVRAYGRKEEVTAFGIVLPESKQTMDLPPEQGEVVAVGPGRALDNGARSSMDVKVGDKVFFCKGYGTKTIKMDGVEYLVVRMDDIEAVE